LHLCVCRLSVEIHVHQTFTKYVVSQKREYFNISFREHFGRIQIRFVGICIYVGRSYFMKHSWTDSFNLSFSVEWRWTLIVCTLTDLCIMFCGLFFCFQLYNISWYPYERVELHDVTSIPGSYWTENNFQKWTFCMLWTFPKKMKIK
jgi:hypothetical protein